MFERYTEKARRVIFFARYEASQFGSPYIEAEHLLLGIVREDKALTNRMLKSHTAVESIRKQIESHLPIREKTSTSVDLPLSNEGKRILANAAEEAERMSHRHIGTEHLFLGLLREEGCFAAGLLKEQGLRIDSAREALSKFAEEQPAQPPATTRPGFPPGLVKDLAQLASDGAFAPIIARERELDAVIQVLSHCGRKNAALIGPPGAGKAAIVQGLAQLIAEGRSPLHLARVLKVDSELLSLWTSNGRGFDELTKTLIAPLNSDPAILFVDCSGRLSANAGPDDFIPFLRWVIAHPGQQCIIAAGEEEFRQAAHSKPWLLQSFAAVHIRPLDKEAALAVLESSKASLEKYHEVVYSDDALKAALDAAAEQKPQDTSIVRFALDLLDSAGVMVRLRSENASPEVADIQKRVRFISHRMAAAIMNHEFEKARFYSDEERKEKENLRLLHEKIGPGSPPTSEVTMNDVERVLARWSEYPFLE